MRNKKGRKALSLLKALFFLLFFGFLFLSFPFSYLKAQEEGLKKFKGKVFLPHQGFTSSLCEDCHRYLADYKGDIADFCLFCHNGSFGKPVSGTFNGAYLHYGRNCLACHSPHLIAEKSPGLLKAKGRGGEDFCFACHLNQTTQTTTFFKSFFNQGVHNLPSRSKSGLSCLNCHASHSSNSPQMEGFQGEGESSGEKLCFNCHQKQEEEFTFTSHHSVVSKEAGLECVSCHNPHFSRKKSLSNPRNTFLFLSDENDFCLACHNDNPPQKVSTSSSLVPYSIQFPSVQAPFFSGWNKTAFPSSAHGKKGVGCQTCHLSHGSRNLSLLGFKGKDSGFEEEKLCLSCHPLETPLVSAENDFEKSSHHPVEKANLHRPNEDMTGLAYDPESSRRHSECYDCHDPHQATAENPLAGVGGVDFKGTVKKPIEKTYELCFKCHSGYTLLPPEAEDLRQSFDPLNTSYHPVLAVGKNSINSSAFNPPLSSQSRIDCLDCHGSDSGSRSVHGSKYPPLLRLPAEKEKPDGEKNLCFKCHKYSAYKNPSSFTRFPYHSQHSQKFACLTCHLSHGSLKTGLLRTDFVLNKKTYKLKFSLEGNKGSCEISPSGSCHGEKTYERGY